MPLVMARNAGKLEWRYPSLLRSGRLGESQSYEKFRPGDTRLLNVWNSKPSQAMREVMAKQGRGAIPMCSKCLRTDVHFKW